MIQGYFESLRLESAGSGVSVTMLCPGPTFSNILASAATDSPGQVRSRDQHNMFFLKKQRI